MGNNNKWPSDRRGDGVRTKGAERRGIRASDLLREARCDNSITSPRFEYPFVLIKSAHYTVNDDLTALDQAIYYYLIARLRDRVNVLNSIDKAVEKRSAFWRRDLSIEIAVRDLVAYTGVANLVRIKSSLERIARAQICYDLRRPGERDLNPKHLVFIETLPTRLTINGTIIYSIDHAVRAAMALAQRYVQLDLNVFTRFRCRYTSRLYALMAIHATIDRDQRRPWTPEAMELAKAIGYPAKAFHRGNFVRTIERVIAEVYALPDVNRRFDVAAAMPDAKNERFRFYAGSARKGLYDSRPQPVPGLNSLVARHQGANPGAISSQNLRPSHFRHASAFTGADAAELVAKWHRDVSIAQAKPRASLGKFSGSDLGGRMKRYSPGAAFEHWLFLRGYHPERITEDLAMELEPSEDPFEGLTACEAEEFLNAVDQELNPKPLVPPPDVDDPFGHFISTRQ